MKIWVTDKNAELCGECRYFHRHYIWDGKRYCMTAMGHCSTPQIKARTAKDSCGYFEKRDET